VHLSPCSEHLELNIEVWIREEAEKKDWDLEMIVLSQYYASFQLEEQLDQWYEIQERSAERQKVLHVQE
jgi:hypothetical protein